MAKALKIASIVVGVAALAVVTGGAAVGLGVSLGTTLIGTSISASALLLAAGALSAGAALLTKTPKVPTSQTERLFANIDPRAFRKDVLGQTAFPIDVRYEEWSGANQEYCDWIVCFASHAIDGLEEIWFNTEMAWSATTGVVGKYAGYFSLPNLVLEGSPANAFSFASGRWGGQARLTGCAYARFRFKTTGNSKKAESPFASGIPSRITAIGRGAKLYDPRRDSTVPGGSGPMRWDDQSTWRYTADDGAVIGENLPLHILRRVLGWRIRNPLTGEMRLATGSGVPGRRLDLQSLIVAANLADELVNRAAGGTEPRYHGAAVISEGDDPKTTLDMLCAACCGRFRDTGGRLSLVIAHNDLAAAASDEGLLDDDVVGGFTWDPDPALEATPNVVRGRYVDASTASLYQLIDYPEVRIASPDGQDRVYPLDLGAVESASHSQRVAKQVLQRLQYQREFAAPFDIRAWKYGVGDVVPFTFAPLGFNRLLFRVKEQELGQGGTCQMTLKIEHASIYAWDRDDAAPVIAADPIVYDSRNNPLILAIADAARTAEWDQVADPNGTRPENNATVGAPIGTKVGNVPVVEVLKSIDRIPPIAAAQDLLAQAAIANEAFTRQADRARQQLEAILLKVAAEQNWPHAILRDAGIVIDQAAGTVRIYALDQQAQRLSSAEILLDATKALVTTKVDATYVGQAIAAAQLSPTDLAALTNVIARVTTAETRLDGLAAQVATKAEAATLTALSGTVTSVSQTLDALAGVVSTKVSTTTFDQLATRVGSVEQTVLALGDVAGITTTIRQARAIGDAATLASINALLAADEAARRQIVAAAQARQELTTGITDARDATARFATLLTAQIGSVDARYGAESIVRASQIAALTEQTTALSAMVGGLSSTVAIQFQSVADQLKAQATATQQVRADFDPRITAAQASADGAVEAAGQVNGRISAEVTRLDKAVSDEAGARAQSVQQLRVEAGDALLLVDDRVDAVVDRAGKIEATRTFAVDANGRLSGWRFVGGPDGGRLILIDADLQMGAGRIIQMSPDGRFMKVEGVGFGLNRDLLSWFGPTMAIDRCSRANASAYEATDGTAYFGGGLTAGTLKYGGDSPGLSPNEVTTVGPFGSNGKPVRFIASWSYSNTIAKAYPPSDAGAAAFVTDRQAYSATDQGGGAWFGTRTSTASQSTITLGRSFDGGSYDQLQQRGFATVTSTFTGQAPIAGDSPGNATFYSTIGGGFTVADPQQTTVNRWLRLTLARGFSFPDAGTVQRLSIIAVEE